MNIHAWKCGEVSHDYVDIDIAPVVYLHWMKTGEFKIIALQVGWLIWRIEFELIWRKSI
jgi:hypothetical protein